MAIQFSEIPSSIRKPGHYFEFNNLLAVRTLPPNKQKVLLIGQRWKLPAPEAPTLEETTGTLPAGTYYYTITVLDAIGETIESEEASITISDNKGVKLTWTKVAGARGYVIYGRSQQNKQKIAEVGDVLTYTDDGSITPSGNPPTKNTTGAQADALVPLPISTSFDALAYFGYGSILHLMAEAAIKANPYLDLTAIALDDADGAVAATGAVTIGGTVLASGTLTIWVGNKSVAVTFNESDTPQTIASAIVNGMSRFESLIESDLDWPVWADIDDTNPAQINLIAKNKGVVGNQIKLAYELTPPYCGLQVSLSGSHLTGGAGEPDIQDALDVVFADRYHIIVTPYNNATSLGKLRTHLETVSNAIEQRGAIGVFAIDDSIANVTTLAKSINCGRMLCAYLRGTRSIPYEVASALGSVMALEEDPARPLNGLELKGIAIPAVVDRLSRNEQEICLWNGVTPLEVTPDNRVVIVRAVSTYVSDISWLDITTIRTLDYVRDACRERIKLRFQRSKLSSKTPAKVKSELLDVLLKLEELEIVEEVLANKDALVVERNLQDPNRLDAKIPADVVNGLHVFAGRIDLLL